MLLDDRKMQPEGFIDLHTHGIGRYDTRTDNPQDILKIAELHGKAGTSAILPTIYAAPIDEMRADIESVRKAMEIQKSEVGGQKSNPPVPPLLRGGEGGLFSKGGINNSSLILGVHLEGPFLNPLRCGAMAKETFIRPTIASLKRLVEGYEDIVKIITIAPELAGGLKVIEKCAMLGIRVNMGHSDATYKQAVDGKKAGATGITHIFNAMRPFHHREPGIIGLGLLDEDLYIEVIADGFHIHPRTLELIFNTKRLDRIILVSDSVKGAGRGKRPIYNTKGTLAGSAITVRAASGFLKSIGIPEVEAIEAGIENPMRYLRAVVDKKHLVR